MTRQKDISHYVSERIEEIEHRSSSGAAKAQLAKLRRGVGKRPGEMPELWGVFLEDLPESLIGKSDGPSPAENAIYTAMTLYALAQQGSDPATRSANTKGVSLGRAARQFAGTDEGVKNRMETRLKSILASEDVVDMERGIRSIIQLIKSKDITIDYPRLAEDLYTYSYPDGKERVRMEWGRDFCRPEISDTARNENDKESNDHE